MVARFEVNMTPSSLYDCMMKQSFSSLSGILCEFLGIFVVLQYFQSYNFAFIVFGCLIMLYLPIVQYLRARMQCKKNPAFSQPLRYTISDEGIRVMSCGKEQALLWSSIGKAVSTTASVILYTTDKDAIIFPKHDMGDAKDTVVQLISAHVDPKMVNIR